MLSQHQFEHLSADDSWLHSSAERAYMSAGHLLHPDEMRLVDPRAPGDYITEHSGVDPLTLRHLSVENAGEKFAEGIRRETASDARWLGSPEIRAHMEAVRSLH